MKIGTYSKGILIISIVIIGIIFIAIFWYLSSKNNEKRYEVTTSLQDQFFISEKLIRKHPDFIYDVEVFDYSSGGKKSILALHNIEDVQKEKISVLYSNDDIRAYLYSNYIIYKQKSSEDFKSLNISTFEKLDADKYAYLIPVAKEIVCRNWGFAHYVSEFLLKSKDSDAINTIKRYAQGKFSSEEIENNKNSGYSKNEMQEYFKCLLIQYNLQE